MADEEAQERVRRMLALKQGVIAAISRDPDKAVQWDALADVVACFIAQYSSNHADLPTDDLRRQILEEHVEKVIRLIPANAALIRRAHQQRQMIKVN